MPKGRVMFITNAVKTVGCIIMLFGTHPLLAYAIVGLGAAAYSPAKYGILTELLPPEKLVKANGWIEGLTVASIILGTGLGGLLISPMVDHFVQGHHVFGVHNAAQAAIAVMIFVYAAAAAVNLLIPDTGARYPKQDFRPIHTLVNFGKSCSLLWHDKLGQISLSVTTLFWGAGATLQFLVLAWDKFQPRPRFICKAAILQGVVAIGIAIGAVLAAAYVSLRRSVDVLPIGVLMGFSVAVMSFYKASWIPGGFDIFGFHISFAIAIACLLFSQRGHDGWFLRCSDERVIAAPRPCPHERRTLHCRPELQRKLFHSRDARSLLPAY